MQYALEFEQQQRPVRTGRCVKCGAQNFAEAEFCYACFLESGLERSEDFDSVWREFGDYELIDEIDRGGQGIVYRARQKSLNREVALKLIAFRSWTTEAMLRRFRHEAEMAASLDHPAIVPIYEFAEQDGCCYFSMKLLQGAKLDELITRKSLTQRRAAALVAELAGAVQHAHERGVLHRDIKPANILMDANGKPHLTDFGLARLIQQPMEVSSRWSGTPSYMAPEQIANGYSTKATDVYGLGTVLYQLLTGRPPFLGENSHDIIRAVSQSEPSRPHILNPHIDRELEIICLKCLQKNPQLRYVSASALAEDLERWLRHRPTTALSAGIFLRGRKFLRRNRSLAYVAPLILALTLGLLALLWKREMSQSPPRSIAVLPFQSIGEENHDQFIADAIQDDLLSKLSKVRGLKVISRTSVMQYRSQTDVHKIGRALGVSHLLEGTVRKQREAIHLNVQLIDTAADRSIWSDQYDRYLTHVFEVEADVARKVVQTLKMSPTAAENGALGANSTGDVEAYNLYLQAKSLSKISRGDDPTELERLKRAVDLLEKAVLQDPKFSLAYCLLTETNLDLYWIPSRADLTRRSRAEKALQAAQRLAPEAGETHLASALFHYYGNHDYDRALEELETSARLLPNNAEVADLSGRLERRLGRWSEAIRHFFRAHELDPRDATHLVQAAVTYSLLRHYRDAEQTADRGIAAFPELADDFWHVKAESALAQGDLAGTRNALGMMSSTTAFPWLRFRLLLYQRHFLEAERFSLEQWWNKDDSYVRYAGFWSAIAARASGDVEKMQSFLLATRRAYEKLAAEKKDEPDVYSSLGLIDVALGRKDEGLRENRMSVELRPISRDAVEGPEYATLLAIAYAWSGEKDRAIEQLFSVANLPAGPTFGMLKLDPDWDELRSDPRFDQILFDAKQSIRLQIPH